MREGSGISGEAGIQADTARATGAEERIYVNENNGEMERRIKGKEEMEL